MKYEQKAADSGWESAQENFRERSEQIDSADAPVIRKADVEIRTLAEWRLYASTRGGDALWRDYHPEKELARVWCPDGIGPIVPPETRALLSSRSELHGFSIKEVRPDYRVRFDDLPGEPPNLDLLAVGELGEQGFVMGVQGRVDEPFGAYVSDELVAAARRMARELSSHTMDRITRLANAIMRPRSGGEPHLGELRYNLLAAIGSTLACATQMQVPRAVFMVHEFRTHLSNDSLLSDNQRDLERVIERVTNSEIRMVPMNHLLGPLRIPGNDFISGEVELYVGKVRRELLALDF